MTAFDFKEAMVVTHKENRDSLHISSCQTKQPGDTLYFIYANNPLHSCSCIEKLPCHYRVRAVQMKCTRRNSYTKFGLLELLLVEA
ncbi:hypothetical protein RJT34_33520 [Clitoria ternatea]|uniref:Uncharacterized protein n=1 Tax=Clitoria ternatea TaxID=43366 RepID=A0AAN9F040_CLITE